MPWPTSSWQCSSINRAIDTVITMLHCLGEDKAPTAVSSCWIMWARLGFLARNARCAQCAHQPGSVRACAVPRRCRAGALRLPVTRPSCSVGAGPWERALGQHGTLQIFLCSYWKYFYLHAIPAQVLFLYFLLSSCHGQEYPAKVGVWTVWCLVQISMNDNFEYAPRLIRLPWCSDYPSSKPSVVCQNTS